MKGVNNNFDSVRVGLAVIVFFSHLWALTENQSFWLLANIFDANFAVKGFFAISGYLVTKSYLRSSGLMSYAEKRLRRIYPAYIGAIALCFLIGLTITELSAFDFIKSIESIKYLVVNSIFLNFLQPTLPGVFLGNHLQALDGSLWTIKIEVMLYICVPVLVYLFKKFSPLIVAVIAIIFSISWVVYFDYISNSNYGAEIARQFPGQLSYFTFGAFFAMRPSWLAGLKWIAFLSLLIALISSDPLWKAIINPIAFSSIVLYLCTTNLKLLNLGRYGDISYGIYLYHFPIIQLCVYGKLFDQNIFIGLAISSVFTLLAAYLSWNLLEKPFLKRNSHYIKAQDV